MNKTRNPIQSNLIDFAPNMRYDCRKYLFLSYSKKSIVNLLSIKIINAGRELIQYDGNEDRVIE